MSKSYALLPCNGLDKCAGCISREVALLLAESTASEIICPVLSHVNDAKYSKMAQKMPLLVIDGCATRCASKLAAEKNWKIAEKVNVTEAAKLNNLSLGKSMRLGNNELQLAKLIADKMMAVQESGPAAGESIDFPGVLDYETYQKDKFTFRVPTNQGFFYNENDVWAYITGDLARIGVTDFVQKSLSDILYFTPPALGIELEQFEEAGSIESGKAVFEIVSPVSGIITAINEKLLEAPELINQNPYEQGWIVEMKLTDLESDRELLHDFDGYFPILKRKVDEFHV